MAKETNSETILNYGKYTGKKFGEIPIEYLKRIAEQKNFPNFPIWGDLVIEYLDNQGIEYKDASLRLMQPIGRNLSGNGACYKVAFPSKKCANDRLKELKKKVNGRNLTFAYLCHNCGLWHLTSQKRR